MRIAQKLAQCGNVTLSTPQMKHPSGHLKRKHVLGRRPTPPHPLKHSVRITVPPKQTHGTIGPLIPVILGRNVNTLIGCLPSKKLALLASPSRNTLLPKHMNRLDKFGTSRTPYLTAREPNAGKNLGGTQLTRCMTPNPGRPAPSYLGTRFYAIKRTPSIYDV